MTKRRVFKMMAAVMLLVVTAASCSKEVKSVELSQTTLSLTVGDTVVLKATVLPDKAVDKTVAWASSNPDVASVGIIDGIVRAIKAGETTITVTTTDGGKTAECKVTVSPVMTQVRFRAEILSKNDYLHLALFDKPTFYGGKIVIGHEFSAVGTSDYYKIPAGNYSVERSFSGYWEGIFKGTPTGQIREFLPNQKYTIVFPEEEKGYIIKE